MVDKSYRDTFISDPLVTISGDEIIGISTDDPLGDGDPTKGTWVDKGIKSSQFSHTTVEINNLARVNGSLKTAYLPEGVLTTKDWLSWDRQFLMTIAATTAPTGITWLRNQPYQQLGVKPSGNFVSGSPTPNWPVVGGVADPQSVVCVSVFYGGATNAASGVLMGGANNGIDCRMLDNSVTYLGETNNYVEYPITGLFTQEQDCCVISTYDHTDPTNSYKTCYGVVDGPIQVQGTMIGTMPDEWTLDQEVILGNGLHYAMYFLTASNLALQTPAVYAKAAQWMAERPSSGLYPHTNLPT